MSGCYTYDNTRAFGKGGGEKEEMFPDSSVFLIGQLLLRAPSLARTENKNGVPYVEFNHKATNLECARMLLPSPLIVCGNLVSDHCVDFECFLKKIFTHDTRISSVLKI